MSKIKKCITMLLALAVVLSVVQIPAFAETKTWYLSKELNGGNWTSDPSASDCFNNPFNCWYSGNTYTDKSGASWWTGGDVTTLGGSPTKVWMDLYARGTTQTLPKGSQFIVECFIKGINGGEYVFGLNADQVSTKDEPNTTFTAQGHNRNSSGTMAKPGEAVAKYGLYDRATGALVGRKVKDGKDVLMANKESSNHLNATLTEAGGTTEAASPNDGDWHFYKIYCDGSKYTDELAADVTVTIDGKVYNPYKLQMNGGNNWTGVFFMNKSTGAANTKFAQFREVKVYTTDAFKVPTSNDLSYYGKNTYYKDNGTLHRWIWNDDGSYKNIINGWYNTDPYRPGNNASFWTGNGTTMLGDQQTKAWKYFEKGAKIDKNTSFIVECEMRGYGGGEYVMGLTSDNVKAGDTTYNSVSSLGTNLTGALIGRGSDNKLKVNTDSDVGLNKSLFTLTGDEVTAPADVTDVSNNTTGWHKYKIYCDASKYPNNLYMDVTVTDVTDSENPIVYKKTERVGTATDGSWNGIFFMNNSKGSANEKLAEFKSIKVYVPDKFIVPNDLSGSITLKSGDSAVGETVTAGTSVKAEADIINTAAKTGKAYLILAEYNSDDRVTAVKVKEIGLNNSETQTGSTEDIALSGIPGGYVRAFLWTDKFQPICRADKADITAAETVTE